MLPISMIRFPFAYVLLKPIVTFYMYTLMVMTLLAVHKCCVGMQMGSAMGALHVSHVPMLI